MVRWCDKLFIDGRIMGNLKKVKKQVETGKLQWRVYCICVAQNEKNLFDILNTNELLFKYYKRKEIKIIGLASSSNAARELLIEIVDEIYQNTGKFQLNEYFKFL